MARYIASDPQTAATLRASLPAAGVAEEPGDAFQAALAAGAASALLPAGPDAALLVELRPRGARQEAAPEAPSSYVAGGFLGLADEPVYEEEKPAGGKQKDR